MAYEGWQFCPPGIKAGADLSSSQYLFVKLSAVNTVIACAATTDIPFGVLQNAPVSGAAAVVCVIGLTKVQGDVNLAFGDVITTSADGQAAVAVAGTDTTRYAVGQVVLDNSAAAGLATVVVNCASPGRAG